MKLSLIEINHSNINLIVFILVYCIKLHKKSEIRQFKNMAATYRHQNELKKKAEKAYNATEIPIEKLRAACLMRGASGIRGLSRYRNKIYSETN